MMSPTLIFILMFLIFSAGALFSYFSKKRRLILITPVVASSASALLSLSWAKQAYYQTSFTFIHNTFLIDSLSIFHIFLVNVMFTSASFYLYDYFKGEKKSDISTPYLQQFTALWQVFQAMLLLVVLSNNIGLTWISLELTTLVSAFLIYSVHDSLSIEAMWKYLLVCSIGIALGFIGTIFVISAAHALPSGDTIYTFTELQKNASSLNGSLMLFAFIFLVIGYGTKAGFAPMHTWLPDAHSQAPTPVSAVFSGVMLNCALFVIMRYLPIVKAADNSSNHANMILLFFGCASLLVAVIFTPIQKDIKRLLAYCSVEHLGLIAIGLAIGGTGTFVALFHTLNHSFSKILAFFSAGAVIKKYKTRNINDIKGILKTTPLWGTAFLFSMFTLIGIAPSSIFLSEFLLLKSTFTSKHFLVFAFILFALFIIFASILKYILGMLYDKADDKHISSKDNISIFNRFIILLFISEFIIFGLWLPGPLKHFLQSAAHIIEKGAGQ